MDSDLKFELIEPVKEALTTAATRASPKLEQREFQSELLVYDEGVEGDCTKQMLKKLSRQMREAMRERRRTSAEEREAENFRGRERSSNGGGMFMWTEFEHPTANCFQFFLFF